MPPHIHPKESVTISEGHGVFETTYTYDFINPQRWMGGEIIGDYPDYLGTHGMGTNMYDHRIMEIWLSEVNDPNPKTIGMALPTLLDQKDQPLQGYPHQLIRAQIGETITVPSETFDATITIKNVIPDEDGQHFKVLTAVVRIELKNKAN